MDTAATAPTERQWTRGYREGDTIVDVIRQDDNSLHVDSFGSYRSLDGRDEHDWPSSTHSHDLSAASTYDLTTEASTNSLQTASKGEVVVASGSAPSGGHIVIAVDEGDGTADGVFGSETHDGRIGAEDDIVPSSHGIEEVKED